MAYEHREGSGSLFKNDKKGNDKAPDMKGDALYNGELVSIAAWRKSGAKGDFYSLKIEPKQQRGDGVQQRASQATRMTEEEQDALI